MGVGARVVPLRGGSVGNVPLQRQPHYPTTSVVKELKVKDENVVPFRDTPRKVAPKSLTRTYRTHKYKVTYIPSTRKWKWTVSVVSKMEYSDVADTQLKAFKAAERFIDKNCRTT